LDKNWQLKKKMVFGISNDEIQTMYETARRAGAIKWMRKYFKISARENEYQLINIPVHEVVS